MSIKRYLFIMRFILNAQYLLKYKKVPQDLMKRNLEEMKNDIPFRVYSKIKELSEVKINGHGRDMFKEIPVLDEYYKEIFAKYQDLNYDKKNR